MSKEREWNRNAQNEMRELRAAVDDCGFSQMLDGVI